MLWPVSYTHLDVYKRQIVLIAGWVLVHDITAWKDVEFGDETTYLGSGLTFSVPFIGGVQWLSLIHI